MAEDDGYIYYGDITGEKAFYKKNIENSEKEKISEDKMLSAKVVDDWIYYTNISDEGKLYKMRKDGTQKTKLNDNPSSVLSSVVDGWVYFGEGTNKENSNISKMRIDGTEKTKLSEDAPYGMIVTDGWIYYVNYFNNLHMYKMKIDGTEKTKLNNDKCGISFIVSDGWIYYTAAISDALDSEYKLFKIRIDGTDRKILIDKHATPLMIYEGWIYCDTSADIDGSFIFKMRLDGTDIVGISSDRASSLNVINGWIYYITNVFENNTYSQNLYKMRTDGSERQAVE